MICQKCQQEREAKDFISKNEVCYKCVYTEKMNVQKEPEKRRCRICERSCDENRWVYCSKECSLIGEMKQKKGYWTTKVRSV